MQRLSEAWFAYNGRRCADMGLKLRRMPLRRAPERIGEKAQALGRDGYIWMDGGAYAPVGIDVECATADGADLRAMREWLLNGSEAALVFSDEQDRAYFARVESVEMQNEKDCYDRKIVRIGFACQPHRYHYPAAADIVLTAGGTVVNPGTADSEPRIFVEAGGDFILYVNGEAVEVTGGSIVIDSHLKDCIEPDGVTLANGRVVLADFPLLSPGPNAVSWTGAVTKVTIVPRWRDV